MHAVAVPPAATDEVSPELIERYDRPGPRYTSYPTAVEFDETFGDAEYRDRLHRASRMREAPLSLYVHLPFCRKRCSFCGCNVIVTDKQDVVARYLDALEMEIEMLADALQGRRVVTQYHWGGGTPTYLTVPQMERLHAHIAERFTLDPHGEQAIEVDPRVTTPEQLDALRRFGFNRISLGVQDLNQEVQAAIGRDQDVEATRRLFEHARGSGFDSVNLDLIYGLPMQTPRSFSRTMEQVLDMRPDRVALYSYAHLPTSRGNQRRIDEKTLPVPRAKLEIFCAARRDLQAAGYQAIGMDHFALPTDEMALAAREGTLYRNFMGYTVEMGTDMVGVGTSAIGEVGGAFAQNTKKLNRYHEALAAGRFPVERGYRRSTDDEIRKAVITDLMCKFRVEFAAIERRFGIAFDEYFGAELEALRFSDGLVRDGMAMLGPSHLEAVGHGRLFVRNLAMVFDAHRANRRARLSRTV